MKALVQFTVHEEPQNSFYDAISRDFPEPVEQSRAFYAISLS